MITLAPTVAPSRSTRCGRRCTRPLVWREGLGWVHLSTRDVCWRYVPLDADRKMGSRE